MDQFVYILIAALVVLLTIVQVALALHLRKKKAPDAKPLLIINIAVFLIWVPLSIIKFTHPQNLPILLAWVIVAALYMGFVLWYTNKLSKNFMH